MDDGGKAYTDDFFPALMKNSVDETGQIWAIPFQRSTPVLYYNKDLFSAGGARPSEQRLRIVTELVDDAKNADSAQWRALGAGNSLGRLPVLGLPELRHWQRSERRWRRLR